MNYRVERKGVSARRGRLTATLVLGLACLLAAGCGVRILPVGEPARMTVERLQGLLGKKEVVVVDLRHHAQWSESPAKIPGAVRGDPKSVSWARQYDKGALLVLYCA